jgi:predicted alpha/beta-hydrolase family hydrolase
MTAGNSEASAAYRPPIRCTRPSVSTTESGLAALEGFYAPLRRVLRSGATPFDANEASSVGRRCSIGLGAVQANMSPLVALAHRDLGGRTVSLVMDTTTANITMFAVAAYAGEREAHVRGVNHFADRKPPCSRAGMRG